MAESWPGNAPLTAPDGRKNWPLWQAPEALDASAIDLLELHATGLESAGVVLLWTAVDGGVEQRGELVLQGRFANGADERRFRFRLRDDPRWRGRIVAASFHTDAGHRSRAHVLRVDAIRQTLDRSRLAEAATREWRVPLGPELRAARPVTSDRAWSRAGALPPSARLDFGFGISERSRSAVSFRVVGELGDASPVTLFERTLAVADAGRWFDAEVELPRSGAESAVLRLELSGGPNDDSVAFYANPTISTARRKPLAHPDVFVISLDTFRADRMSANGYPLATTPRLDAFAARRALRFSEVVSQAPATLPAHTSIFTGLTAIRHNANKSSASDGLVTLAERLRDAGYETFARTGGAMLHRSRGLAQGFDVYRHWADPEHRDEELEQGVAAARSWLSSRGSRPRFVFLHSYEIHGPYRARQPYFGKLHPGLAPPATPVSIKSPPPETGSSMVTPQVANYVALGEGGAPPTHVEVDIAGALYDSAIAYSDDLIGALLEELEGEGRLDEMIVVFTSDHGESFGEHGLGWHGHLYDDNLRVPLLVAAPGHGHGVVAAQVRSMDLFPTILELAGLAPQANIDAVSLLAAGDDAGRSAQEAWSYAPGTNRGVSLRLSGRLKYIFNDTAWLPILGREEVYDLRQDPRESTDLAAGFPRLAELRERVRGEFDEKLTGWRLTVQNGSEERLAGSLGGFAFTSSRIHAFDPATSGLRPRAGGAAFEVPPGSRASWTLDGAPVGELAVGLATRPPLDWKTQLPAKPEPHSFVLRNGRWEESPGGAMARQEVGVRLEFRGEGGPLRPELSGIEAEHMRQLVALGYIN